jgi:hypothetical protein
MRIDELSSVVSASIWLAMTSTTAWADSFRCGTTLIQEGMSSAEILDRCGDPDLVKVSEEPIFTRLENGLSVQVGVTTTHYWYYGRDQGQFVARVALRESIADEIELLTVRDIESVTDDFG